MSFHRESTYYISLIETCTFWCKQADTSMDANKKTKKGEESTFMDKGRYKKLVGKLINLSYSKLDITFSISVVSI